MIKIISLSLVLSYDNLDIHEVNYKRDLVSYYNRISNNGYKVVSMTYLFTPVFISRKLFESKLNKLVITKFYLFSK